MNKTITIYELLGLVKDGKAPKKIKYDTKEYIFRNYDYKEVMDALIDEQSSLMECIDFYKFDEPVEIIEDNDKLEKINVKTGDNCKRFIEYDDETGHHKYTIRLLDEYFAKNINKIIGVLNERNMEKH